MLGRTGDYLNSALMALGSAADWFGQADRAFGENIRRYYEKVREEDLLCTHTLVPPQANRALAASQQAGGSLMARVIREDDSGVVIAGARLLATIGPFADELLVFPSSVLRNTDEDKAYSFACAIPSDTPGLRYIAREPLDYGRPHHDHPLGSRFDEPDAVVVFDDVHVPYERCFVLGDPELCNGFYTQTSAIVHTTHQVITRTTAKTEFILGLVSLLTEAIGIERFQHVQADVAEVIAAVETLRAFGRRPKPTPFRQRLRGADTRLDAAEHGTQPVPEAVPAVPRDLAQARRVRADGHSDARRRHRSCRARHRDVPAVRHARRGRPGVRAVPPGCGSTLRLGVLRPGGAGPDHSFGHPVRMAGADASASYNREPYKEAVRAFLGRSA